MLAHPGRVVEPHTINADANPIAAQPFLKAPRSAGWAAQTHPRHGAAVPRAKAFVQLITTPSGEHEV